MRYVNLISKDANLVFYVTVSSDNDAFVDFLCRFNVIGDVIQKVQRYHGLIKAHAVR